MPWFLQVAIEQGLTILNWYENLPKNEVPPEHLWEDAEGLEQWWARIEAKRAEGAPGGGVIDDSEDSEMTDNDMGREFRKLMSDD